MKLALEQHFESNPAAKEDYDEFTRVFDLLAMAETEEVEAPHGFRARVMEQVAREHARQAPVAAGPFSRLLNILREPRKLQAALAIAGVAVVAAISGVMLTGHRPAAAPGSVSPVPLPTASAPVSIDPSDSIVQSVTAGMAANGAVSQNFLLRLPKEFQGGTVDAYAVTSTQQIRDTGARASQAKSIVTAEKIAKDEDLTIPVLVYREAQAGSTLNIVFDFHLTTVDGHPFNDEVAVFTPMNPSDSVSATSAPPMNGKYFDSLQTLASQYHVTIIADTAGSPDSAEAWSAADGIETALARVVGQGNAVKPLTADTYFVYRKQP